MIRWVAAVRAGVLLCCWLAGGPVALTSITGNPLPRRLPPADAVQAWMDAPFDPRYAAATARTFAWLLWATVTLVVLAVAAARVRRWRWRGLRQYLPAPAPGLAATLVGAATVAAAGTAAAGAAAHAAPADAAATGIDAQRPVSGAIPDQNAHDRAERTVVVLPGDTLSAIAAHQLGDTARWPEIFQLNRHRHFAGVGGTLTDPDLIYPGWRLTLPAGPGHARPGNNAHGAAPAGSTAAAQTGTPSAGAPAATPAASAECSDSSAPVPQRSPSATAVGSAPAGHRSPPSARHGDNTGPLGGWLPLPLTAALAGIGAAVWLRRRQHTERGTTDADAARRRPVMPEGERRMRTARPATPPPTADPSVTSQPGLAAARDAGAGGRGLIGPGAFDAARAVLVTALTAPDDDPNRAPLIVVPAPWLTAAIGEIPTGRRLRMQITADLPEAIRVLDTALLERHRVLLDHDIAELAQLRDTDPDHPALPPILLLADAPPVHLRDQLQQILLQGSPVGITAVLLGDWPARTITIDRDGHTAAGRLDVLDMTAARQLLAATDDPAVAAFADSHVAAAAGTVTSEPSHRPVRLAGSAPIAHPPPAAAPADEPTPVASSPVPVHLFGPPTIFQYDGSAITGLRHHARELLVYLAVHRGGANLPDIMEAFWPNATMRRAAQRLSTEVADLRRHLRQAADNRSIQPVVNTGGRYHLDPDLLDIDLWRFIDILRRLQHADTAARPALLQQACDSGTAPLADGYRYEWVDSVREQLRRDRIRVRVELAQLVGRDDPAAAADLLAAAAALDPADEELAQRLMRALAAANSSAAVPGVLEQLRAALHNIDEQPSEATVTLAARLAPSADHGRTR
ncbi:BTAD domain-containing putative transcriptional regulator [Actinoplanes sp. CA-030573]|uniref:BTAD domain-containing putative transcriptional regulator n=1 Tax=Actinoplanes sp. CA-030573 TaxID=3239898 RepID=UPI003D90E666